MIATSVLLKNAIGSLLLPPGVLIAALLLAWLLRRRLPRGSAWLFGCTLAAFYLLSTPWCSTWLLQGLEPPPPTPAALAQVDALVVLGGGKRWHALDQPGGEALNNPTLTRIRYGAQLARRLGKPLLVSGGAPKGGVAEAVLMREALEREFGVPVRWVEARSADTADNATETARLLLPAHRRVALVSQAWHLPRATRAFASAGFEVVPAGTDYASPEPSALLALLPNATALWQSRIALHEWLGLLWHRLRGQ
ncbi:YdcF family protein [Chitiniphilus shinanonensis]|uniref:YdcF family protein n=1 Tax=Chitiniphilus shinanonensis TaxID=553088 RepID=UPI00303CAB84